MPPSRRHILAGTLQHAISRFIDRKWRLVDDTDRSTYLQIVDDLAENMDWIFLAFALMSSHTHWAFIFGESSFSAFFHRLHTKYGIKWRKRYDSVGPIFAGRPKNYEIDSTKLLSLISYVHMNPVRAGVVAKPADSTWTSHCFYLRTRKSPHWLNIERSLSLLGFTDTAAGRKHFDDTIRDIHRDESFLDIRPHDKQQIHHQPLTATNLTSKKATTLDIISLFVEKQLSVLSKDFRSVSKHPTIV